MRGITPLNFALFDFIKGSLHFVSGNCSRSPCGSLAERSSLSVSQYFAPPPSPFSPSNPTEGGGAEGSATLPHVTHTYTHKPTMLTMPAERRGTPAPARTHAGHQP